MPTFTFFERLPSLLYPYGTEAFVRRLNECVELYGYAGAQYSCTDLIFWHSLMHLLGALLLVSAIALLRKYSVRGALVVSVAVVFYFIWQELIDQPLRLGQIPFKSWLDMGTWLLPLVVYWVFMWTRRMRSQGASRRT